MKRARRSPRRMHTRSPSGRAFLTQTHPPHVPTQRRHGNRTALEAPAGLAVKPRTQKPTARLPGSCSEAEKWLTLLQLCGVTFFSMTPNVTQSVSSSFSVAIFSLSCDSRISFRPIIFLSISVEDTRGRLGRETNCQVTVLRFLDTATGWLERCLGRGGAGGRQLSPGQGMLTLKKHPEAPVSAQCPTPQTQVSNCRKMLNAFLVLESAASSQRLRTGMPCPLHLTEEGGPCLPLPRCVGQELGSGR